MGSQRKTVVVTGASQGIGDAVAKALLNRGYNVVGTSRSMSRSSVLPRSEQLTLIDGDVAEAATAARVTQEAVNRFGSIDGLVNNAGIFLSKRFTDYTVEDFQALSAVNLYGFLHMTQAVIRQMLAQARGGSIVSISASVARSPIAGVPCGVPMMTKGGIEAASRNLALEFAKDGIRVNIVAPGAVRTPLVRDVPEEALRAMSPIHRVAEAKEIAEAVVFLIEAPQVTGETLHVDGGAHVGKW